MTLKEAKEILKEWARTDLEILDGDTESDYAKYVLKTVDAIETVLLATKSIEEV